MSRVIHVQETAVQIEILCKKHDLRISVIEPLASGGLRVVMLSPNDTATLRHLVKDRLIIGKVTRSGHYVARTPPTFKR